MKRIRKKLKRFVCPALALAMGAGILYGTPFTAKAADHEARIGDVYYEDIESAFQNVQSGETITVLKDCSVSGTLRVTRDDITLQSENADAPVTVSRDEDFTGKTHGVNGGSVLLEVTGRLTTQDIILDGGAVLDDEFNNSGRAWKSALVYVDGTYTMESGTVLQNNYVAEEAGVGLYTAGGLYVAAEGTLVMDGALIQNCYTTGTGGGVNAEQNTSVTAASGTIMNCHAISGGGMKLGGTAELSNMTFIGNSAGSSGGGISSTAPLTVTDSLFEGNSSAYDGGGICTSTGHLAHITGCTFTGNTAARGSAIQTAKGEGTLPLVIRDCTFTGNPSAGFSHAGGAICYGNETGIVLSGKIVMEDNLTAGVEPCDIHYFYNTGASILLDEDFESDSTFVLGGYDTIKPGRVLIDGRLYHKDASTEQFVWHTEEYCTEKRGENIYLAEVPKTYTVRYDANNDPTGTSIAVSDPNRYTSEDTAVIMEREELYSIMGHFINPGYDLVGWNTEPDGTGTDYIEGQEISLTADLYLYAKWEAKKPATVTITYIYNNGMEDGTDTAKVIPGADIAFPDASRKGYCFKGWYEDEDLTVFAGNAGETRPAPQNDTTYYAAWEKADATVTFDADGGKMEGGDIIAKVDDTITLPTCTKDGYEFAGWYDNDTCVGQAGEDYTVTSDVTLKAHYVKKETPTCIITFDTNGGKAISSVKVEKGKAASLPEAEKENYIFLGWYTEKEGGEKIDAEFAVTEDITLYAHWEKEAEKPEERLEATIAFDADGGKMEGGDVIAKVGDTITLPTCTKDGYEFVGWYDNDTCVGQAGEEYTVTSDVTLKAHYVKKETPACIITFDTNGGKAIASMKVEKGKAINLPETEKENHIFLGWYTEKESGEKINDQLTVTEDITLYAHWEKKAETPEKRPEATITFDADGGKMEDGNITAKVGDTITLPTCTKEGYEFVGWYDDDTCAGQAGEDYTVTGDVILKARYEKKAEITYLITFDPNGGRKAEPVRAAKGEKITLPGTEKAGYIFLGWYTEKDGGILLGIAGDELEVTKDMTVYALWEKEEAEEAGDKEPETCKAVFHTEGGKLGNATLTIVKGAGLYLPLPEKKGYDFAGWYLDKSLTQFAGTYRDSYRITKDTDFYAKWEKSKEDDSNHDTDQGSNAETKDTYTVKYDANGGSVKESSVKVEKGAGIKLPTAEREGFTFMGWYTDKQIFVGKAGSIYKPEQDITLYAKWKRAEIGDNNGNTEDGTNSDTKKEASTASTDTDKKSGSSMSDAGQDKKTDTSAEKANGTQTGTAGAETQKEPVLQTGRTSPIYLLAVIGMSGVFLAALSIREGKRSSGK